MEKDEKEEKKDKMEKGETVEVKVEGEGAKTMGEKENFKEEKITTVLEEHVEGKIKQKSEPSKGEIGAEEKTETLTDEKDTPRQFETSTDIVADSKRNNADAEKGSDAASQEHKDVGSSGIDTSSEKDGSHKKDEDCSPNDEGNTNKTKVETPGKPEDVCSEKVEEVQPQSDGDRERLVILEPIWMKRAEILLGEKEEAREELVKELRRLVHNEDNLSVPQDESFFLMYLRAGLMCPKQGFQVLKNHFKMRLTNPEYFQRSTQLEFLAREVYSQQIHAMLPNRDREGRRVYIFRPGRWDPDKISLQ